MSSSTTHDRRTASSRDEDTSDRRTLERIAPGLATPVRVMSFWMAIVLPFLYVPLLVTGLSDAAETVTFLGLFVANLVALYVGHSHRR